MTLHLNTTQDLGHGITIIFICCVLIIISVLLDLDTGVRAARKNKENNEDTTKKDKKEG